jgi:subtilisin family serine protease
MSSQPALRVSRLFPDRSKPKSPWQPGIVEIMFQDHVKPQAVPNERTGIPTVRSLSQFDLSAFHALAQKWHVGNIRPAVIGTSGESSQQPQSNRSGGMFDNLNRFVRLQFDRHAPVEQIAREFCALPGVQSASPTPIFSPATLPNDPYLGTSDALQTPVSDLENQWYIFHCHANDAWEVAAPGGARLNGRGVAIAIVDDAFDANHEDLQANVRQTYNAITNDNHITQLGSNNRNDTIHGTAVAGLAGAVGNNNLGICGFAWGSDLFLVQALRNPDQPGELPSNALPQALRWVGQQAMDRGNARTVVNVALGLSATLISPQSPPDVNIRVNGRDNVAIKTIIDTLVDPQVARAVVCIAAGNDEKDQLGKDVSTDSDGKPDSGSQAIVVGAMLVDAGDDVRVPSSNWGSRVTVCAPGDFHHDMTCSAGIDGPYRRQFGQTSGATPKVSGTVALMLQANPDLTHAQVKAILNGTGSELTRSRSNTGNPSARCSTLLRRLERPLRPRPAPSSFPIVS